MAQFEFRLAEMPKNGLQRLEARAQAHSTSTFSLETYSLLLSVKAIDKSPCHDAFRYFGRIFLDAQLLERSGD
jgi:hypothetical protein